MSWHGLEYLKVPQWRTAFEAADVILAVDVTTGREMLVFGRETLIGAVGTRTRSTVLRVAIDDAGEELELLLAACEVCRGRHDYEQKETGAACLERAAPTTEPPGTC